MKCLEQTDFLPNYSFEANMSMKPTRLELEKNWS